MPRDAEMVLARRSAAPARISDRATIKILTKSGTDQVAREGDNGFGACSVERGFAAPSFSASATTGTGLLREAARANLF